MTLDNLKR